MKNLRNKLIASTAMLLIAAIMLTSASFAWYTVSTMGTLEGVNVEMGTTDNLEIAISDSTPSEAALGDAGHQFKWGSKGVYTGTATLSQVATYTDVVYGDSDSGKTIKTASYSDGRLASISDMITVNAVYELATYQDAYAKPRTEGVSGQGACVAIYDFWIRSNEYTGIKIESATDSDGNKLSTFTNAGMTVVFVDAITNTSSSTIWYMDDTEAHMDAVNMRLTQDTTTYDGEYYLAHIQMMVFVDGDYITAADVDDGTLDLPKFTGNIIINGGYVSP